MRRILPLLFSALLCACAVETTEPASDTAAASTCDDIALSVEQCLTEAAKAGELPADCETTINAFEAHCPMGKADWYGDWLCGLGVLRHCDMPACDAPAVTDADSCADYLDAEGCAACDYYLCKEANAGANACGAQGYYLDYGHRYCERLTLVTRPRLSPAGQRWIDDTRRCLMDEVQTVDDAALSCDELRGFAFDSHPDCYIDSGFCTLPLSDWWSVLSTVDKRDLELRQVLTTGIGCIAGYFY